VNESLFAHKIKETLDAGLEIGPEVAARLKVARERALERHRAPATAWVLAGTGRAGVRLGGPTQLLARLLLPAVVLVVAAIGLQHWQDAQQAARSAAQQAAEIEEVDTGVLIGELPIKAYLDEDFQAWLQRTSQ